MIFNLVFKLNAVAFTVGVDCVAVITASDQDARVVFNVVAETYAVIVGLDVVVRDFNVGISSDFTIELDTVVIHAVFIGAAAGRFPYPMRLPSMTICDPLFKDPSKWIPSFPRMKLEGRCRSCCRRRHRY